jgi:hypothetical protein
MVTSPAGPDSESGIDADDDSNDPFAAMVDGDGQQPPPPPQGHMDDDLAQSAQQLTISANAAQASPADDEVGDSVLPMDPAPASIDPACAAVPALPMPPTTLHICPATDRAHCSVRMCKHPLRLVHVHIPFMHLQHQTYENSSLLQVLRRQKLNAWRTPGTQQIAPIVAASALASAQIQMPPSVQPSAAASSSSSSIAAPPQPPSSLDAPSAPHLAARPLVLFLDTNSVFNMISARHEVQYLDWNRLLALATAGEFGAFGDPDRSVYLVLCSAVLSEMDARKEYAKRTENGPHGAERAQYFMQLAKQIKHQFGMDMQDQSAGFVAQCKRAGFLVTVSVAQGEANVMTSLLPTLNENRHTSDGTHTLSLTESHFATPQVAHVESCHSPSGPRWYTRMGVCACECGVSLADPTIGAF